MSCSGRVNVSILECEDYHSLDKLGTTLAFNSIISNSIIIRARNVQNMHIPLLENSLAKDVVDSCLVSVSRFLEHLNYISIYTQCNAEYEDKKKRMQEENDQWYRDFMQREENYYYYYNKDDKP